jgi:hypothetical protein
MKKVNVLFLILFCCFLKEATAQSWDSLSSGLEAPGIYCMYADSADNYLYIGGYFSISGGVPMGGIVRWDGNNFSPMNYTGLNTSARSITRYKDTILACGAFYTPEHDVVKWNGTSWDIIGHVYNGTIFSFTEYNNELYATGVFDSIADLGTHANNIAKWNGISWSTIKDTMFNGAIDAMAIYNNEIYIGGNFDNASAGIWRIVKWNGTNYVPLSGGGVYGGMDDIVDMVVYNNELYVSGTFTKAAGNAGNYIQKWNGTSWSDVGGGVMGQFGGNGQIHDMKVYNNELYVAGVFSTAGGVPAQYIAKWDGTNWCSFGSTFDNTLMAIEFKSGDMYVAGAFYNVDGDSITGVAKWTGGSYVDTCGHIASGINETVFNNEELSIYPNPVTSQFTIEFTLAETKTASIEIKNILGETVKIISTGALIKGSNRIEMDVSELSGGVYFVQLQSGNSSLTKKIIRQ